MSIKAIKRAKLIFAASCLVGLAACNATDSTLGVSEPSIQTANGNTAALTPNAAVYNVYFAPIVGAPVASITPLSSQLSAAAPANRIALQPSASQTIDHEIRGYFSALSQNGSITVIHVWDVFSRQGQRVHRIQDQVTIPGTANDPWAAVPPETMQAIADKVLAEYAAWRGGSS